MVVGGEGAVGALEGPEGVDSQVPGLAEVEADAPDRCPIFLHEGSCQPECAEEFVKGSCVASAIAVLSREGAYVLQSHDQQGRADDICSGLPQKSLLFASDGMWHPPSRTCASERRESL